MCPTQRRIASRKRPSLMVISPRCLRVTDVCFFRSISSSFNEGDGRTLISSGEQIARGEPRDFEDGVRCESIFQVELTRASAALFQ